jgi:HEAT repeat protein
VWHLTRAPTDRLRQALTPLLASPDRGVRDSAALVAARVRDPAQPIDPKILALLEATVLDVSRPLDLRTDALKAIYLDPGWFEPGPGVVVPGFAPGSPVPVALRRCGLALARQLESDDEDTRIAAAALLHMIDPDSLAGRKDPAGSPSQSPP